MEGHVFTSPANAPSTVAMPIAGADTSLPGTFAWLRPANTTIVMQVALTREDVGYTLLASSHAAEDAERRRIARRRQPAWAAEN
jgi:hypothetical protein